MLFKISAHHIQILVCIPVFVPTLSRKNAVVNLTKICLFKTFKECLNERIEHGQTNTCSKHFKHSWEVLKKEKNI